VDLYFRRSAARWRLQIAIRGRREANISSRLKQGGAERLGLSRREPAQAGADAAPDDGRCSQNAAILQYVAGFAGHQYRPRQERSRLHQWLSIGTELHKGLFVPMLDKRRRPK
jgi:glutathione S-transferase